MRSLGEMCEVGAEERSVSALIVQSGLRVQPKSVRDTHGEARSERD